MATFPTNPDGGPITRVARIPKANAEIEGGPATPVFGYKANAVPSGAKIIGGPAITVTVITAADLKENGGNFTLEGETYAMPVMDAGVGDSAHGGGIMAIYVVNPAQYP